MNRERRNALERRKRKLLDLLYQRQHRLAKLRGDVSVAETRLAEMNRKLAVIESKLAAG